MAVAGACSSDANPQPAGDGGIAAEVGADIRRDIAPDAGPNTQPDAGQEPDLPPLPPPVCPTASGAVRNATCNDLTPPGPCVRQIQVDDSSPAPASGTLVAGTYDLTERTFYTSAAGPRGPVGEPLRETIVLSGVDANWTIQSASLSAMEVTRMTRTAVLVGSQLRTIVTCPVGSVDAGSEDAGSGDAGGGDADDGGADEDDDRGGGTLFYTADGQSLTLYRLRPAGPVQVDSYTRR